MPKYHIHLYPIVRVLVRDVEAESQVEAIKKAERMVDQYQLFRQVRFDPPVADVEFAEDTDGFLVDEDGDTKYEKSTWYENDYTPSPPDRK